MKMVLQLQHDRPQGYGVTMHAQLRYHSKFEKELETLINKHSIDVDLNMADFILARMLTAQLAALEIAQGRQNWQGRPAGVD